MVPERSCLGHGLDEDASEADGYRKSRERGLVPKDETPREAEAWIGLGAVEGDKAEW